MQESKSDITRLLATKDARKHIRKRQYSKPESKNASRPTARMCASMIAKKDVITLQECLEQWNKASKQAQKQSKHITRLNQVNKNIRSQKQGRKQAFNCMLLAFMVGTHADKKPRNQASQINACKQGRKKVR